MKTTPSDGRVGDGSTWTYEADPSADTRLGISLSGGGIRSATFSLGVQQRLAEAGIFHRARYLSAVSGGSYLAAGLAISHALCPGHLRRASPPPWARGSPEEARLRRNLSYLAPGGRGRMWLFANLLYGLMLNLTPLLLGAFLFGRIAGLVLREAYPGLGTDRHLDLAAAPLILGAGVALVLVAVVLVGIRRFNDKTRYRNLAERWAGERGVMVLLSAAIVVCVVGLVLPGIIHLLAQSTSGSRVSSLGLGDASWRVRRLLLGLVAVGGALALGGVAVWLLRRRRLAALRGIVAGLSGAAVLLVPMILAAETATVRDWSVRGDGLVWLAAIAIMLVFAVFAHNRRYSMHLFYRERIQDAFASRRAEPSEEGGRAPFGVEPIPYEQKILLSDVAKRNAARSDLPFPELIMCAAVAARGPEVPSKAWAASFTFDGTISGNSRLGLQAPTTQIERGDWLGGGALTLPSMMAISGAAVSPLMGRFTLPAFRFLMAVLNIRLGVWIRNPNRAARASGEARPNRLVRLGMYLLKGWREPGAWYVLKEGLGLADTRGRYIYVSDGGHWENLGLTELVRRRCTHIVVVDASGDPGLGDIGRAIAVARAELGVEIDIDPRCTQPGDDGLAEAPVAVGTFRYPDDQGGDVYYARCVMWDGAPSDLHLFASRESLFPNHPTSNQFLSGELFDAYRALGWVVGEELVSKVILPPVSADEPRPGARDARLTRFG